MILVIGGAYQGKRKLVLSWLESSDEGISNGDGPELWAEGSRDAFDEISRRPVIYGVDKYLARLTAGGEDPDVWLEQLIAANPQYVIMDEIGYGIVPVEPGQRALRELTGRAGQRLAGAAEAVYRVVCGIPVRVK